MSIKRWVVSWGALGMGLTCLFSSPSIAGWQSFQTGDGLADNRVSAILETSAGDLWFGTEGGASRYDGERWITYLAQLPHPSVTVMDEDLLGNLWMGTQLGGVTRFDGTTWTEFNATGGHLPSNQIQAVMADSQGEVWVGTPSGLARYSPSSGSWQTYTPGDGSLIHINAVSLHEDRDGNLWVGSPAGVTLLDPTRTLWTDFSPTGGQSPDSVLAVGGDTTGAVWFGTDQGAFRYQDGTWEQFTTANSGLLQNVVKVIRSDDQGGVWFGHPFGLSRFDGRTWRTLITSSQGNLEEIRAITTDRSGNLWVSRQGGTAAVLRFDGERWFTQSVFANRGLTDILEDTRNEMWFTTDGFGVVHLNAHGKWSPHGLSLPNDCLTIFEDSAGYLWIGSRSQGARRIHPDRQSADAFGSPTIAGNTVYHFFQDSAGFVWAATDSGVSRYDGSLWVSFLDGGGIAPPSEVYEVTEDIRGALWFRTLTGLYKMGMTDTEPLAITTAEGLADTDVNSFLATQSGEIWFATANGLSRFDGADWITFPTLIDSFDTTMHSLLEDRGGNIWVGSFRGVSRWDGNQWETFDFQTVGSFNIETLFEDDAGIIWISRGNNGMGLYNGDSWRLISDDDGLASNLVTRIFQDRGRRMWFGSFVGLTEYWPDRTAPQTVFITAPAALLGSRTAPFVYDAGYGEAGDLEFQPFLDENPLTDWNRGVSWDLNSLGDGVYTFAVRSRDWTGNIDPTPATLQFEVDATPPTAVLSSPVFGAALRGTLDVVGTASDPRFVSYEVAMRPASPAPWPGEAVTVLSSSSVPAADQLLARWPTETVAEGNYDLRLSVIDNLGLVGSFQITVMVDNLPPFADVTAPALISSAFGGDVFSTHGDVHLYFPPRAFARDAVVNITQSPDPVPVEINGGRARGVEPAYEITWADMKMEKTATFDLAIPESLSLTGTHAVYRRALGGSAWTRLGGTLKDGALSFPISESGVYALFVESESPPSGTPLARLAISPRILAPSRLGNTEVAISFVIGSPGPVRVKVYNRAGRLVRDVMDQSLPAGANLVRWNGRNDDGNAVSEGLYLVTVEADGNTHKQTLAVVR